METRADALPSGPRAPCWAVLVLHGSWGSFPDTSNHLLQECFFVTVAAQEFQLTWTSHTSLGAFLALRAVTHQFSCHLPKENYSEAKCGQAVTRVRGKLQPTVPWHPFLGKGLRELWLGWMGLQCLGKGAGDQDQCVVEKAMEDVLY